jgi:hypothetical protein
MYRDFNPKRYWESKPWCSVCGQRRIRKGTICHQCLTTMKNKQKWPLPRARISSSDESEEVVNLKEDTHKEESEYYIYVLERQRPKQRYRLTMAPREVIANPAIALKLKNDFGITFPDLPENPEDSGLDTFLEETKKVIAQRTAWQVSKECQIGLFSFLAIYSPFYEIISATVFRRAGQQ